MDPFSGRGNAPYLAAATGRPGIAVDILPIAWLFTTAKVNPSRNRENVLTRLNEIGRAVRLQDRKHRSQFEKMAWAPGTLGFLRAARRELNWKESRTDRTLAAILALYMQDNSPNGLSNRFSPTVAHSPTYAVKWWTQRDMLDPPDTNPVKYLSARIKWRYAYGLPDLARCSTYLGNAREVLDRIAPCSAKLIITSPPYHGVTDYVNEQWLRNWLLGSKLRKDWKLTQRHSNLIQYRDLIKGVLGNARQHVREDGAVIVRCGSKPTTANTCREALETSWPKWRIFERSSVISRRGKASGYGHGSKLITEKDILAASPEQEDQARLWAQSVESDA